MEPGRKPAHALLSEEAFAQVSKAAAALRKVLPGQAPKVGSLAASGHSSLNLPTTSISDLVTAFAEIAEMRKTLACRESFGSSETQAALGEYQLMLRQFKASLPRIQGWLLAERARLASKRSHSAAVESWLRTSRQTRW